MAAAASAKSISSGSTCIPITPFGFEWPRAAFRIRAASGDGGGAWGAFCCNCTTGDDAREEEVEEGEGDETRDGTAEREEEEEVVDDRASRLLIEEDGREGIVSGRWVGECGLGAGAVCRAVR